MYQAVSAREYLTKRSARRGVSIFVDVVMFLFHAEGITNLGIYNRRKVRGGSAWSLHSVGRAADFGCSKALGNRRWVFFIRAAGMAGICEIIWNGQRWTQEHGIQPYHGEDDHTTHVHVGFTIAMADNSSPRDSLISWFVAAINLPG